MRRTLAAAGIIGLLLAGLVLQPVRAEEPDDAGSLPASEASTPGEVATVEPSPPVTPPPQPPPGIPSSPSSDGGASAVLDWLSKLDPRKWAIEALDALFTFVGNALLAAMRGFVDWALGLGNSSLNFVTRTPAEATYANPPSTACGASHEP